MLSSNKNKVVCLLLLILFPEVEGMSCFGRCLWGVVFINSISKMSFVSVCIEFFRSWTCCKSINSLETYQGWLLNLLRKKPKFTTGFFLGACILYDRSLENLLYCYFGC